MTTRKILCLGDLHLGVRPSRVPPDLDPEAVSVATVWRRAVDLAIEESVGLVLLSGDVVWEGNPLEPLGPLERELGRLVEVGIEVCAVAGNHDFDVLPRLYRTVGGERFRLLGQGGRWEPFTWKDPEGGALLHVHGWSFSSRDVRKDPVAAYDLERPADGAPILGLVHGDLGQVRSTNAPLSRASLERAAPEAWVLGHIHKPALIELVGGQWALYPGSPQPLDPTEEGPHGVWLLELREGRLGRPAPVGLATLRWETVEVDLSGVGDAEEAQDRAVAAAREAGQEIAAGEENLEHLLLTVRLRGRTAAHRSLPLRVRELEDEQPLVSTTAGVEVRIAQVRLETRPPVDLEILARSDDPPGIVAALLLDLGEGREQRARELLERTAQRIQEVRERRHYLPVAAEGELEPATSRDRVEAAAWSLLDALLAQKGAPRSGGSPAPGPGDGEGVAGR